jgi:5-methylcytosine-specific restriction endonuclease McrA
VKFTELLTDPLLVAADFRCQYCGLDLLSDFGHLFAFARDHVKPRSRGGADHPTNLAIACAACDRLKGGSDVATVDEARRVVGERRLRRLEWFERIREQIRG